jgi:hypothetical protein
VIEQERTILFCQNEAKMCFDRKLNAVWPPELRWERMAEIPLSRWERSIQL